MGNRLKRDEIKKFWGIVEDPSSPEKEKDYAYGRLAYDHFLKFKADLRKISNRPLCDMLGSNVRNGDPPNGRYMKHYTDEELEIILYEICEAREALAFYEKIAIKARNELRKKKFSIFKGGENEP